MSKKTNTLVSVLILALVVVGIFWVVQFGGAFGLKIKKLEETDNSYNPNRYPTTRVVDTIRIQSPKNDD